MSDSPIQDKNPPESIQSFLKPLAVSDHTLYELSYLLSKVYKHQAANSADQFLPTPVTYLPTGRETGRYLAVYVGLSYLRIAFIELLGEASIKKDRKVYRPDLQSCVRRTQEKAWWIEERLKEDHAEDLFTWIGDCIAEVVAGSLSSDVASTEPREPEVPAELEIAISFCCPILQRSVTEAILMPTTKGFALTSDLNLHQALLDGYERHTRRPVDDSRKSSAKRQKVKYALPKLRISAMTNDTVATFTSLAYTVKLLLPNSRVVMGLIVGSGCNATVPMALDDLHESKTQFIRNDDPKATTVVVSTEWTLSYTSRPLQELGVVTAWDKELELCCDRPGFQPLEYMVGGRYTGELVRIIMYDYFINVLHFAKDSLPRALVDEYALTTELISLHVAASRSDSTLASVLMRKLPPPPFSEWNWTAASAGALRAVASAVQNRSASLVAASTVGLLACTGEIQLARPENPDSDSSTKSAIPTANNSPQTHPNGGAQDGDPLCLGAGWRGSPEELVVAYSGGVIQHYPQYNEACQRYLDRLVMRGGPQVGGKSVLLRPANDGGIVGVGVLAGTVAGRIEGIIGSSMMEHKNKC